MDELEEVAENIREARAGAPERRSGGCGCVGWGIGAIVLLLLADGVLHIWFPLLFVLLLLIVAGMGFTLLIGAIRSRGAARGTFDPRNADWHPLATVASAGRGQGPGDRRPAAGGRTGTSDPPPAASPADPSATAAAAGMDIAGLAAPPGPAPDGAERRRGGPALRPRGAGGPGRAGGSRLGVGQAEGCGAGRSGRRGEPRARTRGGRTLSPPLMALVCVCTEESQPSMPQSMLRSNAHTTSGYSCESSRYTQLCTSMTVSPLPLEDRVAP